MLQVSDLSLHIHQQRILNKISFSLAKGQVLGIVGESGSGKSMTAYALMQLLPRGSRTTGSVELDGRELTSMHDEQLCSLRGDVMSMVFQEPMTKHW